MDVIEELKFLGKFTQKNIGGGGVEIHSRLNTIIYQLQNMSEKSKIIKQHLFKKNHMNFF